MQFAAKKIIRTFAIMNIGFDAKRAFHNQTGLGHYSRTLIRTLADEYPEHEYYLFNPRASGSYKLGGDNIHEILPSGFLNQRFRSAWRSSWVKKDLKKLGITIYHGLSNEVPRGISNTGIKSVVTIHDLIFERYPKHYNKIDVLIYKNKFRYACENADHVIAISQQTKDDIIDFYKIAENKITVCYQSCNPAFYQQVNDDIKQQVKIKYGLPGRFYLYVGAIAERKNLLGIAKAMNLLKEKSTIPLVVIGSGSTYKDEVKTYIKENGLEKQVIFLSENEMAKNSPGFKTAADFPAIYQLAECMIYPSVFEGFGIPVLEAMASRLPVITTRLSCLPETAGDAAWYVDPYNAEEMAEAMAGISHDGPIVEQMKMKGWLQAQKFLPNPCADAVMEVYKKL
jgi:glycosyltransferase involved in cell wall biosynthesis